MALLPGWPPKLPKKTRVMKPVSSSAPDAPRAGWAAQRAGSFLTCRSPFEGHHLTVDRLGDVVRGAAVSSKVRLQERHVAHHRARQLSRSSGAMRSPPP